MLTALTLMATASGDHTEPGPIVGFHHIRLVCIILIGDQSPQTNFTIVRMFIETFALGKRQTGNKKKSASFHKF
jgi:hypothetical protein